MVDAYGRWTYEQDTPEDKKCDLDRVADALLEYLANIPAQSRLYNYKIETSIENIVYMIFAYLEEFINEQKKFDAEEIVREAAEYGCGIDEFDYYC